MRVLDVHVEILKAPVQLPMHSTLTRCQGSLTDCAFNPSSLQHYEFTMAEQPDPTSNLIQASCPWKLPMTSLLMVIMASDAASINSDTSNFLHGRKSGQPARDPWRGGPPIVATVALNREGQLDRHAYACWVAEVRER